MKVFRYAMALMFVGALATPALAQRSFDICITPATDVLAPEGFTPGAFLTVAANIFPDGTIPDGGVGSCPSTGMIGTFYANVGLELGLPAATDVEGFVTWHFDFSPKGTFVTVGPVPFPPNAGGPPTYPQTLSGASGPFPNRGTATVTSLNEDGFQFRITLPGP